MAGVSRTMWLRGINADAATEKANAHADFREKTAEITRRWKEGFKALKEENDEMQERVKRFILEQTAAENRNYNDARSRAPAAGMSKTNYLRDLARAHREAMDLIRKESQHETMDITQKWKEGFKALKEENDRMQEEAKESLARELFEIEEMKQREIAQGPPR